MADDSLFDSYFDSIDKLRVAEDKLKEEMYNLDEAIGELFASEEYDGEEMKTYVSLLFDSNYHLHQCLSCNQRRIAISTKWLKMRGMQEYENMCEEDKNEAK